jgi:hypothetical protein
MTPCRTCSKARAGPTWCTAYNLDGGAPELAAAMRAQSEVWKTCDKFTIVTLVDLSRKAIEQEKKP